MKAKRQVFRIFICGRRRVRILKSFTHTYLVEYISSGKTAEVYKNYVRSWQPSAKPQKAAPSSQLKLF